MADALIVFEENDPLKASTTNANNNFLLDKITETAQTIENEIDALQLDLETQISTSSAPIGAIIMWSSSNIPENWLAMVGQDISNEAYADLRTVIGTSTLPNTIGRCPQGANTPLGIINAGLPDLYGSCELVGVEGVNAWGVFAATAAHDTFNIGHSPSSKVNTFDMFASRYNAIYGASNTVQPNAWTTVFIIKYK